MDSVAIFGTLGIGAALSALAANLVKALIVALICYIVIKAIRRIFHGVMEKTHFERGLKSFMENVVNVALWSVAVIIVCQSIGIQVTSLVAVLSVAGVALSLSVQGIMSNLFSGVCVLGTRPFVAGDYVSLNGVEGVVEAVGFFYTSIKTVDNKVISVPNSEITSAKVINFSREDLRRVDLTFCASYDNATEQVKGAIMEAMQADSRILTDPAPFTGLLSYKDSCIEYVARAWVRTGDYWDVYFALNEAVRESFRRNGVEMTYNHVNVHMVQDN